MKPAPSLLWAGAFLASLLPLRADSPPPPELLSNPDFALPGADPAWPDGWGSPPADPGKRWEAEEGRRFVRLTVNAPGPGRPEMLYREVALKPDAVPGLVVAVRARASGAPGGAEVLLVFKDKAGRLLSSGAAPLPFPALPAWSAAEERLRVPPEAVRLIVLAGLPGDAAGAVDLASLSCTALDADAAAALPLPALPAMPGSLLPSNGDFEQADATGGWPADWGAPAPGLSWEKEDGKRFVRFGVQQPGRSLMLRRTVPLPAGLEGLELAARWRAAGVRHGEHEWFDARTIVRFLDKDGGPIATAGGSPDLVFTHKPAPTGWIEQAGFLPVPEGAAALELQPGFFQAAGGTLDLASLSVVPLDPARARLLKLASAAYGAWKGDQNAAQERRMDARIAARLAATGNLVPNGDFGATAAGAAAPDEWNAAPGLNWEQESGLRFARLSADDPAKVRLLYKMVVLPAGTKALDLAFLYRTAGVRKGDRDPGDARVALHFLDGTRVGHLESGRVLPPDPDAVVLAPDAKEWTEVRRRLAVPEGATKLQWMAGLWYVPAGTLDLARIRVSPVDGAAP